MSRRDLGLWAVSEAANLPKRKNGGFDGRVLITLAMHAGTDSFETYVGQTTLAEHALGIDRTEVTRSHIRQVQRALGFLEEQGLVTKFVHAHNLGDHRSTNVYRLDYRPFVTIVRQELAGAEN